MVDIVGQLPLRIAIVETTAIFAFMKMSHKCRKNYFFYWKSFDGFSSPAQDRDSLFVYFFVFCLFVTCSPAQDRDGLAQEENQLNKSHPGSLKKTAEYVYIQLRIYIYMYTCKHMLMR